MSSVANNPQAWWEDDRRLRISENTINDVRRALRPLLGVRLNVLNLPRAVLSEFEPSQVGTIVGTLVDACLAQLHLIVADPTPVKKVGLAKHAGILKDREGYPDFMHDATGTRLELKGLYVDPIEIDMKRPATKREPSARLTQKVTVKNVDPARDVLLVLAYQLRANQGNFFAPEIIDFDIFSMIDCIEARDRRLLKSGRWFGHFETPVILSGFGRKRLRSGLVVDTSAYGRKKSEARHYNEDTNFGKLQRIPHPGLRSFLRKHSIPVEESAEVKEVLREERAAKAVSRVRKQ